MSSRWTRAKTWTCRRPNDDDTLEESPHWRHRDSRMYVQNARRRIKQKSRSISIETSKYDRTHTSSTRANEDRRAVPDADCRAASNADRRAALHKLKPVINERQVAEQVFSHNRICAPLADEERGRITRLHERGASVREVARPLKRSTGAVRRVISPVLAPTSECRDRKPVFSAQDVQRIVRKANSGDYTATQLLGECDAKCCVRTARCALQRADHLGYSKMMRQSTVRPPYEVIESGGSEDDRLINWTHSTLVSYQNSIPKVPIFPNRLISSPVKNSHQRSHASPSPQQHSNSSHGERSAAAAAARAHDGGTHARVAEDGPAAHEAHPDPLGGRATPQGRLAAALGGSVCEPGRRHAARLRVQGQ
ncbi:hypothetical protein PybrP1_009851, partial [[Pythium] brassicae (nom. inval.)]